MGFAAELAKLTRFEHAVMLAAAVLIAEAVALGALPPAGAALAISLLVPVFSEMGSFALNDYLDVETDRRNKKKGRPLVDGTIAPSFALWFSVASLAASTALAAMLSQEAFAIALAFNLLAVAYNWKLKDLPLVGNVYIALTMAIPFVFGSFVFTRSLAPAVAALAMLGFVSGLAREIIKSVQDMEGDVAARGSKTLPVLVGRKAALAGAAALYALFIPLAFAPFAAGLPPEPLALGLVALGDAIIATVAYRVLAAPDESFGYARNASLAAFALGMLGFLAAAL